MRRAIGWAVTAAILGVAFYAQTYKEGLKEGGDPLTAHAAKGQIADAWQFQARLDKVEAAKALGPELSVEPPVKTDRIFVIATLSATATTKYSMAVQQAYLLASDGRRFEAQKDHSGVDGYIQPGFWRTGQVAFDVPPDVLAGASIVVRPNASNPTYGDFYPEAALDLGLNGDAANALVVRAKEQYTFPKDTP